MSSGKLQAEGEMVKGEEGGEEVCMQSKEKMGEQISVAPRR